MPSGHLFGQANSMALILFLVLVLTHNAWTEKETGERPTN